MKIFFAAMLLFLLGTSSCRSQAPESYNASEILLQMKKLNVLGSVLYIAAHPDDENTRLLAWLSKEKLYRTGYLSLTRGDGGQNLLGDEQGVELGLIRTQELLAARRIDGAEQFFSRAFDFGFSKTTEESLRLWDEKKILSDVVWVIRKFQPDVIITRFPEDRRAGHGQHSASSVLAHLAFSAAADPNQFPEQFKYGVHPWQAKRIFWNNYNFGGNNNTSEDQLKVDVGGFNPLIGKSYGEIAAESRSQHRSQGFGASRAFGNSIEYFSLTAGARAGRGLMEGVDDSWKRVTGAAGIEALVNTLIKTYNPADPSASIQQLIAIYRRINALADGYWKKKKLAEVQQLIEACSGLWIEATVHQAYGIKDQLVPVQLQLVNRSKLGIGLNEISINRTDTGWNQNLEPEKNYRLSMQVSLAGLPVSQPYWLEEPMSENSYNVKNQELIGDAQNQPALTAVFEIKIAGQLFQIQKPVLYEYTQPAKGESFEPFVIIPKMIAACKPEILLFTGKNEKDLLVTDQSGQDDFPGEKQPAPGGSSGSSGRKDQSTKGVPATDGRFSFPAMVLTKSPGFDISADLTSGTPQHEFRIRPAGGSQNEAWTWATQSIAGRTDTIMQCRTISYEHIPRINYFRPVRARLVATDLQIRGSRIGYIEGAGDKVPDALREMGYTVVMLNESGLTASALSHLDAVIAGVRAYDVHDWLFGKYEILMDYVRNGGNLIVQYNRNNSENARTRIGPYPFGISNTRVTEEDAAVHFLQPDDPVLHFPNQITQKDFEGWSQERGIYFATQADPQYRELFSMHDKGEPDHGGSLITADYGKGKFVYTGLVFFRELPAGVPGAYRLLANLIAQNQNENK